METVADKHRHASNVTSTGDVFLRGVNIDDHE